MGEYTVTLLIGRPKKQEAQLMLTNPYDACQSRSPNIVPFHMLSIVSY